MTELDKAREWADSVSAGPATDRAHAAAKIIQSLPDHWVDAEKVAELADDMANWRLPDEPSTTEIDYHRLVEIMDGFTGRINDLLAPPLPTLDELIEQGNSPQKYRGMQAKMDLYDEPWTIIGIHGNDNRYAAMATVDHFALNFPVDMVTPLPDLPRLEWPAQAPRNPETPPAETLNNTSSDTPRNPNPEDVPANEPWLLEIDGNQCIGTRLRIATARPWSVAALNGSHAFHVDDSEVTLIHKLVTETHALPEGMRLADHETYGRVVVSPGSDSNGFRAIFYLDKWLQSGVSYGYAKMDNLTFLDGEA